MNPNHNILEETRREYESHGSIFILDDEYVGYQKWISDKPLIFNGVRGSGKTSILEALKWNVAWYQSKQSKQPKQPKVKLYSEHNSLNLESYPNFISIFIQGEKSELRLWRKYRNTCGKEFTKYIFSTYLEWVFLENISEALYSLFEKEMLPPDRNKEYDFISEVSQLLFKKPEAANLIEPSFFALKKYLFRSHSDLRRYIIEGRLPQKIFNTIPILQVGELLNQFTLVLKKYFPVFNSKIIFILIDDFHRFHVWQQQLINTMILTKSENITFKLSILDGASTTRSTLDPSRILGENDLETISFGENAKSHKDTGTNQSKSPSNNAEKIFIRLINGVIKTRYQDFYNKKLSNFDIKKKLNTNTTIHEKVYDYLKKSVNKEIIHLLDEYDKLPRKKIPILKFLISKKSQGEYTKNDNSPKLTQKELEKLVKNKYHLSIALHYCENYPYSGFNEVYGLAGTSVRSFIMILNSMAKVSETNSVDHFLNLESIPIKTQIKGIKLLSDTYMESLDDYTQLTNALTEKTICNRFGEIYKSFYRIESLLISPECNAFKVKNIESCTKTYDIIQKLLLSGTLRELSDGDCFYLFINPLLSPHFNLTYRKPFTYYHQITKEELTAILTVDNTEFEKLKGKIFSNRVKKNLNLELKF